ncbi:MAG TPA: hopanoid biosynthesis-associated protein HpnK [Stellaceae bacterium]|nr:hopanoid biosynthesis-associated protein HpnK [Stellaceae bacterium]
MPKRLIVTADDFGLAVPVNEAVELGHLHGILTSASLMVTAPAAADAVERARRLPRLAVGLHLVLMDGRPALPPEQIPDLIGADGRFAHDPVRLGARIYLSSRAQAQVEAEMRAQLAAYQRTGLRLDHVDGHHHFHLHPTVQAILLRLAREFGISAIRVPDEPVIARRHAGAGRRMWDWLAAFPLRDRAPAMKRRLARAGIRFNDSILGLADSGRMDAARMRELVAALPDGVTELYIHPATRRWDGPDALPHDYRPEGELAALMDASVRATVMASGAILATFGDLTGASATAPAIGHLSSARA